MINKIQNILHPSYNAFKNSPPEYKFFVSLILASFWCVAFGIYTSELLFIGYSILGHYLLIICTFITWSAFHHARKLHDPGVSNKVKWDLEKEA